MLQKTEYLVPNDLLQEAQSSLMNIDFKLSINKPSGNFFYDPWVIKDEYAGTVWEKLLALLPSPIGEARLIKLVPGTNYFAHADMDNRYHLNLKGTQSFLIDLEHQQMFPLIADGVWYHMDAGRIHTAANFGEVDRVQLVVRQLLTLHTLKNPCPVKITVKEGVEIYRYYFDKTLSPWLSNANKQGFISDFVYKNETVTFNLEADKLAELKMLTPDIFEIE